MTEDLKMIEPKDQDEAVDLLESVAKWAISKSRAKGDRWFNAHKLINFAKTEIDKSGNWE